MLEPQSWESYRNRRRMKDEFKARLHSIALKPHMFDKFLVEELKFELVEVLHSSAEWLKERNLSPEDPFKRPLFVYRKATQSI